MKKAISVILAASILILQAGCSVSTPDLGEYIQNQASQAVEGMVESGKEQAKSWWEDLTDGLSWGSSKPSTEVDTELFQQQTEGEPTTAYENQNIPGELLISYDTQIEGNLVPSMRYEISKDNKYKLIGTIPEKDNCHFMGWGIAPNTPLDSSFLYGPGEEITAYTNTTYYAIWASDEPETDAAKVHGEEGFYITGDGENTPIQFRCNCGMLIKEPTLDIAASAKYGKGKRIAFADCKKKWHLFSGTEDQKKEVILLLLDYKTGVCQQLWEEAQESGGDSLQYSQRIRILNSLRSCFAYSSNTDEILLAVQAADFADSALEKAADDAEMMGSFGELMENEWLADLAGNAGEKIELVQSFLSVAKAALYFADMGSIDWDSPTDAFDTTVNFMECMTGFLPYAGDYFSQMLNAVKKGRFVLIEVDKQTISYEALGALLDYPGGIFAYEPWSLIGDINKWKSDELSLANLYRMEEEMSRYAPTQKELDILKKFITYRWQYEQGITDK